MTYAEQLGANERQSQRPITDKTDDLQSVLLTQQDMVSDFGYLPLVCQLERDLAARFRSIREQRALLLELLLLIVDGNQKLLSVMDCLAEAERAESDVWLRDDIKIAWLTCMYAGRDYAEPHVAATYQYLGIHPDKVWPAIIERRKALLGPGYIVDEKSGEFFPALPRKKPAKSVRDGVKENAL